LLFLKTITFIEKIVNRFLEQVGKETGETAHMERWNNTLRQRLGRFVRKSLSSSKCIHRLKNHLLVFIHRYNSTTPAAM
jgi:IS1 family transposase